MDSQIQLVCDKMAEYAGLNSAEINWMDSSHLRMEWTSSQEKEFIKWFQKELLSNKSLRLVTMNYPTTRRASIKQVVNEFVWNYGFKTKADDKNTD